MLTVLLHGPNFSVMSSQMISRDDSCSTDKIMFCYMVVVLVLRLFRGQNSELIWATRQKRKERKGTLGRTVPHFAENRPISGHGWCGPGISEAQSGAHSIRGQMHGSVDTVRVEDLGWCGARHSVTCRSTCQDWSGYKTLLDWTILSRTGRLNSSVIASFWKLEPSCFGVQAKRYT